MSVVNTILKTNSDRLCNFIKKNQNSQDTTRITKIILN